MKALPEKIWIFTLSSPLNTPYGRIAYAPFPSMQESSLLDRRIAYAPYRTYSISNRKNDTISFIWTPEGRAINTGNGYEYFLTPSRYF